VEGVPVQPSGALDTQGVIELNTGLEEGLQDIEGFSHIILLYYFHLVNKVNLKVIPFLDVNPHGIFATRSPTRPNRIGISIVKLIKVEKNLLYFENADILDQTPLLDIKPFFPQYDNHLDSRSGWLEEAGEIDITRVISDKRFE
jgi:tRNA-Thr(GGU) m(6)t(6)A37 methyltransferase TsaA